MFIYVLLLTVIVALGCLFVYHRRIVFIKINSKMEISNIAIYCALIALIGILIAGLRNISVGSDTSNYYYTFYLSRLTFNDLIILFQNHLSMGVQEFFSQKNTSLFRIILLGLKNLGFSYNNCLIILSSIYVIPMFYIITKMSENVTESAFWYFVLCYGLLLSGIRITLAMGLILLSFIASQKRKKIVSVLLFALAVFIHVTAIVFLLYFIIKDLSVKKKALFYLVPIFIVAPLIGKILGPVLIRLTYYGDIEISYWSYTFYLFVAISTILVVFLLPEDDKEFNHIKSMLIIGTILCGIVNEGAFMNISRYFTQYLCVVLPSIPLRINNKPVSILVKAAYIIAGLCLYYTTFSKSIFSPYLFFWQ